MEDRKKRNSYRLNRFLARAGAASRRKSARLIMEGKVSVNGRVVESPGVRVTEEDRVELNGKPVELQPLTTAVLNKPLGYETTMVRGRLPAVVELMDGLPPGTVPVGRLDVNTGGLLLLSNEGRLVNRLTHPSWEVEREYIVSSRRNLTEKQLKSLAKGADIGSGDFSRPRKVKRTAPDMFSLTLHTGRNREVRRLCKACGIPLKELERVRYGPVVMRDLKRGSWRVLDEKELFELRKTVSLNSN